MKQVRHMKGNTVNETSLICRERGNTDKLVQINIVINNRVREKRTGRLKVGLRRAQTSQRLQRTCSALWMTVAGHRPGTSRCHNDVTSHAAR